MLELEVLKNVLSVFHFYLRFHLCHYYRGQFFVLSVLAKILEYLY